MAGSVLGQDQIKKLNVAYPALRAHIRALLASDRSAYGLMKVHFLTEFLDTTELYTIFAGLPFISPAEKRALVRAAIYEVLVTDSNQLMALDPATGDWTGTYHVPSSEVVDHSALRQVDRVELKSFTPAQFKLNVTTMEAHQNPAQAPAAQETEHKTPTALGIVPALRQEAEEANAKRQAEREVAVAKVREQVTPTPIVLGLDPKVYPTTTLEVIDAPVEPVADEATPEEKA